MLYLPNLGFTPIESRPSGSSYNLFVGFRSSKVKGSRRLNDAVVSDENFSCRVPNDTVYFLSLRLVRRVDTVPTNGRFAFLVIILITPPNALEP